MSHWMSWAMVCFAFLCQLGCVHLQAASQAAVSDTEKQLYLTPAGKYTQDDIAANGMMTKSQKFQNYTSHHDTELKKGDSVCPITKVKANPNCTWVVDGKTYQFCCPNCIDEFVTLAKTKPEEIKHPEHYVR